MFSHIFKGPTKCSKCDKPAHSGDCATVQKVGNGNNQWQKNYGEAAHSTVLDGLPKAPLSPEHQKITAGLKTLLGAGAKEVTRPGIGTYIASKDMTREAAVSMLSALKDKMTSGGWEYSKGTPGGGVDSGVLTKGKDTIELGIAGGGSSSVRAMLKPGRSVKKVEPAGQVRQDQVAAAFRSF